MTASVGLDLAERALSNCSGEAQATVIRERSLMSRFARSQPTQATEVEDTSVSILRVHDGHTGSADERYLILSNEIGDWIGGLRYWLRGGVAHLVDVVVLPQERHQGHAHRLLAAFEERAVEAGGHVAEFWTDDQRSEGLLAAFGWGRIFQRQDYIGHRTWALMEKRIGPGE